VKSRFSPAAVGMFVLGAVLLGLLAFISFGGTNFFSKPTRFVVYFEESVSGLDPGAAVKVNGVRIGRVAAINVRYDSATRVALVQTICEVDRNVLTDRDGNTIELTNPVELQNLVERGLRAKLNLQGITGLLFVELSFEDPREYPAPKPTGVDSYPVVPAIKSPIAEVQSSIVEIVADIQKIDFAGLSRELKTLLTTANQKVSDLDVKALTERISRAAESVEKFANSPDARAVMANLNKTIVETQALLAKLDAQVDPVSSELKKTLADAQAALKQIDVAAATTRRFVQSQGYLGEDVTRTLQQVSEAASAIQRLAELLERNPNALLVGRKPGGEAAPR
jgi:paraquat-inducible protein B